MGWYDLKLKIIILRLKLRSINLTQEMNSCTNRQSGGIGPGTKLWAHIHIEGGLGGLVVV